PRNPSAPPRSGDRPHLDRQVPPGHESESGEQVPAATPRLRGAGSGSRPVQDRRQQPPEPAGDREAGSPARGCAAPFPDALQRLPPRHHGLQPHRRGVAAGEGAAGIHILSLYFNTTSTALPGVTATVPVKVRPSAALAVTCQVPAGMRLKV